MHQKFFTVNTKKNKIKSQFLHFSLFEAKELSDQKLVVITLNSELPLKFIGKSTSYCKFIGNVSKNIEF